MDTVKPALVTTSIKQLPVLCDLNCYFPSVYFISIKPVLSYHLSFMTIFYCSIGRSYKTVLTVFLLLNIHVIFNFNQNKTK